jgi:predicted amidohydrolase
LRIALGQFGATLGDVEANLARMRRLLADAGQRGADLVCFPELCVSGYLLVADDYSDSLLDAVEAAEKVLAKDAQRAGVSLIYGAPARVPGGLANAVVLREPDGARVLYAKTHMDELERRVFVPGDEFVIAGELGLACCYDLAFPEMTRSLTLRGARVLVAPMAWEVERGFVMQSVIEARAVENVAYLVCINQAGSVGPFRFRGSSCVLDPLGRTVLELGNDEGLEVVDLDLEWVARLRNRTDERTYPLLDDRRPDLYDGVIRP